jgi:hypothetical protein
MPYIGKKPADIIATVIDTTTGTFSGEVDAGSLDVSGNADIDGITNLDNTDIDGTLDVSGNLTVDTNTLFVDSSNNRVGVGTVSPNANTKLDVNGAARIGNSTDGIMIENNTGSFDIDNASYIRRDSSSGALEITSGSTTARNMIFNTKTNGAESARIDSSGNVGIGTSTVTSGFKLEVTGDVRFGDSYNDDAVELGWSAGGSQGFVQAYDRGASAFRNLILNNSVTINSSGNVGIGTSSPNEKFTVSSGNTTTAISIINNKTTTLGTETNFLSFFGTSNVNSVFSVPLAQIGAISANGSYQSGSLVFHTSPFNSASTERMRITSAGNLGLGTTSPVANLEIKKLVSTTGSMTDTALHLTTDGTTGRKLNIGFGLGGGVANTNAAVIGFDVTSGSGATQGDLFFSTRSGTSDSVPTQRMKIKSDGTLLYGDPTATPIGSFCDFVFTDNQAKAVFTIKHAGATATNQYGVFMDLSNDPNDTTRYFMLFRGGATERARIQSNGDMANVNNSFGALSDEKLKEQIVDASSQWDDIKALRVRKYKLKQDVANGDSDEHWRLGVVAQEVEASGMGGLVSSTTDTSKDEEGRIIELDTTTKQVKYSVLYMKAVKALQEAITRIETLETANTALEARIVALENA